MSIWNKKVSRKFLLLVFLIVLAVFESYSIITNIRSYNGQCCRAYFGAVSSCQECSLMTYVMDNSLAVPLGFLLIIAHPLFWVTIIIFVIYKLTKKYLNKNKEIKKE